MKRKVGEAKTILTPVVLPYNVICVHCGDTIEKGTVCYAVVRSQKHHGYCCIPCMSGEKDVSDVHITGTVKLNGWEHMMLIDNIRKDSIGKLLDNNYDILEDGTFKSPVANGFGSHSHIYRYMIERGEMSPNVKAPHMLRKALGNHADEIETIHWMVQNHVIESINEILGYKFCEYRNDYEFIQFNISYESREAYTEKVNACRSAYEKFEKCIMHYRNFDEQLERAIKALEKAGIEAK